jgi:hypothetical protein
MFCGVLFSFELLLLCLLPPIRTVVGIVVQEVRVIDRENRLGELNFSLLDVYSSFLRYAWTNHSRSTVQR